VVTINQRKTLAQKAVEDEIRSAENKVSYYTLRKETFDPVLEAIESHIDVLRVSLDTSSVDISFTGTRSKLNTVFGILRTAGFEPGERPQKDKASYCSYFEHPTGARFWVNFSSTQCRRVQIGTKTVEQPVYETVCDDGEDDNGDA
jgi:hypothetical protein